MYTVIIVYSGWRQSPPIRTARMCHNAECYRSFRNKCFYCIINLTLGTLYAGVQSQQLVTHKRRTNQKSTMRSQRESREIYTCQISVTMCSALIHHYTQHYCSASVRIIFLCSQRSAQHKDEKRRICIFICGMSD